MAEGAPLYALSCPLPADEAAARLQSLGPNRTQPASYRGSTAFEVSIDADPFAPVLDVSVEERPVGSYITVRVVRSSFMRDLMHVARCVFGLCALLGVGHVLATLDPPTSWRALSAVAAGFSSLALLTLGVERMLARPPATHRARVRLAVAQLVQPR